MSTPPDVQTVIEASLPLNSMDFLVLAVLTDGERHGYGIVKDITARTDGRVKVRPGNLYRVIDRLMDRGFVEVKARRAPESSSEPRQHYGITSLGHKVAAAHVALFSDVVAASGKLRHASRLA
ncbi:MAG: PadR family transcriptional regulator [Gemmatimonadota bacterium]|nr:MAG: PadR family transcriptional regulator [Gemmatimonadota bacterium]